VAVLVGRLGDVAAQQPEPVELEGTIVASNAYEEEGERKRQPGISTPASSYFRRPTAGTFHTYCPHPLTQPAFLTNPQRLPAPDGFSFGEGGH